MQGELPMNGCLKAFPLSLGSSFAEFLVPQGEKRTETSEMTMAILLLTLRFCQLELCSLDPQGKNHTEGQLGMI